MTGVATVAESDPTDTATVVVIGPATGDTEVAPALAASPGETSVIRANVYWGLIFSLILLCVFCSLHSSEISNVNLGEDNGVAFFYLFISFYGLHWATYVIFQILLLQSTILLWKGFFYFLLSQYIFIQSDCSFHSSSEITLSVILFH